jgi:hypothetical protein
MIYKDLEDIGLSGTFGWREEWFYLAHVNERDALFKLSTSFILPAQRSRVELYGD